MLAGFFASKCGAKLWWPRAGGAVSIVAIATATKGTAWLLRMRSSLTSASNDLQDLVAPGRHQLRSFGLQVQPHERLRVRGPHVEVPRGVVHGDAVDAADRAITVALLDRAQDPRHLVHAGQLGVDLARDEVAVAQRRQEIPQRLPLLRHQLQDQQRWDEAVVGV